MKRSTLPILAALLLMPPVTLRAVEAAMRVELGPPETVLADQALGLRYFPDERLAVLRTKPDCRVLMAAGVASHLIEGPDMGRFTRATQVLAKGQPGEFDNGYAGITAAVRAPSGEWLAFYHAEDQEGLQTVGNGVPGFYCMAFSDGGIHFASPSRGCTAGGKYAPQAGRADALAT